MPTLYLDDLHADLYKRHALDNEYVMVSGSFALPVAEAPPTDPAALAAWSPVVVVTAHAPYQKRIVTFNTKKDGTPPMIPSPESTGAFIFLGGSIYFDTPRINSAADGFIWEASGRYEFVTAARSSPDDGYPLGSLPFETNLHTQLNQLYGGVEAPFGAVASAGPDVRSGYAEALTISFLNGAYDYLNPSYFPPTHLNSGMLNGSGISPLP